MKYNLVKGKVFVEGDYFTTYGIEQKEANGNVTLVEDISPDIEFVNELIELLREHQPAQIHFNDIIEDSLL